MSAKNDLAPRTIEVLKHFKKETTRNRVAKKMGVSRIEITSTVGRLTRAGLLQVVQRAIHERDTWLKVTEAGLDAIRRGATTHDRKRSPRQQKKVEVHPEWYEVRNTMKADTYVPPREEMPARPGALDYRTIPSRGLKT